MTQENDSGHKQSLTAYKISKYNRRKQLEAARSAMVYNPALPYIDRTPKRKQKEKRTAQIIKKALKKFR